MSVRTDVINLNVNVNGNQAQNQLNDLRKKAADTKLEMEGLVKGTQAFIDKKADLSKITAEMDGLKKQIGFTALSQKELNQELTRLKALKGSVVPFTNEFKDLQAQIEKVESRIYDVKNGVQGLASFFSKIKDEVKQFGVAAAAYLGFEFITNQFSNIINGAGKLSDSLADIRKSAGLSEEEMAAFNKQLKSIDTRTSAEHLRDIAKVGGQLGIAKGDLLGFTAAIDKLNVALGDEFAGGAEEITNAVAKLRNTFADIRTDKVDTDLLHIGNALNVLGAAGVATAPVVSDFAQRIGAAGSIYGLTAGQTFGLSAAFQELGITAERGSTATIKLLQKISKAPEDFYAIAASVDPSIKSIKQFSDLVNTDISKAFLLVSQGFASSKGNATEFANKLADAEVGSAAIAEVLSKVGTNSATVSDKINLATTALKNQDSVIGEFNIKNQTFGATLDKLSKEFNSLLTAPGVTNFLKGAAESAYNLIQFLKELPKWLEENRTSLIILTGVILTYVAAKTRAAQSTLLARAATLFETAADKIEAVQKAVNTALTTAYAYAKDILTGKIKIATVAQRLWNLALEANPLGVVVAVVFALAAAISYLTSKVAQLTATQRVQAELQKKVIELSSDEEAKAQSLFKTLQSTSLGYEAKKKLLNELIAINPEYLKGLTLENIRTQEGAEIMKNYIKNLREVNQEKARQSIIQEKEKKVIELTGEASESKTKLQQKGSSSQTGIILKNALFGPDEDAKKLVEKNNEIKKLNDELTILYQDHAKAVEKNVKKASDSTSKITSDSTSRTIKSIQDQIKALNEAYENIDITDKNALRKNFDERKKLQDELDALNGKTSGEKKDDQTLKQAQEFYKKLQELKFHAEEAAKSKDQQEIDNVKHKYVELLKEYDHFAASLKGKAKSILGNREDITKAEQAELNALGEKQRKEAFEKEQKEIKDNLTKAYTSQQQSTQVFYEDQKNKQAQRFVNGEISKADYEANIRQVDIQSKQDQLQAAEEFSSLTVTIEGKILPAAEQAAKDVTRLKKEQLDKQTNDLVKSLEDQKAERALMEDLRNSGKESVIQTKIAVAYSKKDNDGYFAAQKDLADHQRQMKSDALEKEADDERAKLSSTGAEREAAELLIRTNLRQKLEQVDAEFDAAEKQIEADKITAKVDAVMKYVDAYMTAASSLSNFLNTLENRQLQNEVNRNNKKKAEYKKQLDSKLLSQEQYNLKTQKLDDESETKKKEIARQQAKRDKALNIFSAIVNTSAAIIKMLADPGGFAGVALSIAAGITGLAQIGSIIATPLPELGTGGLLDSGPYHREKERGLHVVDPRTGKTKMLLEKDEAVLTGRAMRSNDQLTVTGTPSQIASRINSRYGGVNWAGGAVVEMPKWRTERPVYINPNMPRIMEQGGLIRPIDGNTSAGNDNAETNGLLRQLISEQQQTRAEVKNWKVNNRNYVLLKDIDEKRAKYELAKKASGLNQ